ncbi:MAG: TIGR02281 family clan AA aspartic protease [Candidatus Binatia bacterium]
MRAKFFSSFVLIIFCWVINEAPAEDIFRWSDEKGTLHFADNPKSVAERYRNESPKRQVTPFREAALPDPVPKTRQANVSHPQKFTIPLTREDGRLLVNGNINSHSSVRFIVDTGASITIIPASMASRLGLDPKGSPSIEIRGVGGAIDGRLVEIDSLKVGGAEARSFDVVVIDDDLRGAGLLGADFLSRFQIDINYTRQQMVLQPGEGPYDGYPAAWWQEKFRLYNRLKRGYEQRIRQNEDHLRTLGINPEQRNWEVSYRGKVNPLRPISDEIKEHENYLRLLEKKMSALQLRANRAELPRHLRE